jgi:hypothetical protein
MHWPPQVGIAQRGTPSIPTVHGPEQHSASDTHRSPACPRHEWPGTSHAGAGMQTLAPWASRPHVREQQSALETHTSPTTRHASRSEQRVLPPVAAQRPPQQSAAAAQGSPAGRHTPCGTPAQMLALQRLPQQSALLVQRSSAAAQVGPAAHWRGVPEGHASEQHWPAKLQPAPDPRHPVGPASDGPAPSKEPSRLPSNTASRESSARPSAASPAAASTETSSDASIATSSDASTETSSDASIATSSDRSSDPSRDPSSEDSPASASVALSRPSRGARTFTVSLAHAPIDRSRTAARTGPR